MIHGIAAGIIYHFLVFIQGSIFLWFHTRIVLKKSRKEHEIKYDP